MGYEALIETLIKEGEEKSKEILEKSQNKAHAVIRKAQEEAFALEQENRAWL